MDKLSQASESAYETVTVGKRQYRRVKAEYSTAKVARAPKAASSASSRFCFVLPAIFWYFTSLAN